MIISDMGAAVLVYLARSGRLDDVIDERSFNLLIRRGKESICDVKVHYGKYSTFKSFHHYYTTVNVIG